MAFEALTYFYDFTVGDFPAEWLPLTYLYDPDLPLLPLLYFHELDPALPSGQRPGARDRVFGFVHSIAYSRAASLLTVSVAVNRDLSIAANHRFVDIVRRAARSRLGLDNPVLLQDVRNAFNHHLTDANAFLEELWHKIVTGPFGGKLPFGKCTDEVFGLARFVASWNSDGGRKGELIQLHAYLTSFGERIHVGGGIHADFYLLPTWEEFRDRTNPLALFGKFTALVAAAGFFATTFTSVVSLSSAKYSRFELNLLRGKTGFAGNKLNTEAVINLLESAPSQNGVRAALYDNYSAFNRGPGRSVLSLLMHHDLRQNFWDPQNLTRQACIDQYRGLKSTYQSPKVMQLYAQQCFGSLFALPIDNWIVTFLKGPLSLSVSPASFHSKVFDSSAIWAKVERLIWMSAQARKVHSVAAENILWCIRYGGPDKQMRYANPLGCKVCENHVRAVCPAYARIRKFPVTFNAGSPPANGFDITTSAGNNVTQGQRFVSCRGEAAYDEYTPRDRQQHFASFPQPICIGATTVEDFIAGY